jgi:hypothetical protein
MRQAWYGVTGFAAMMVTACGGPAPEGATEPSVPTEQDNRISLLSRSDRDALIQAALGAPAMNAYFSAFDGYWDAFQDADNGRATLSGCPELTSDEVDFVAAIADGCYGLKSGKSWSGAFEAENLALSMFSEVNPNAPTRLSLTDWSDGTRRWTGEVTGSSPTPAVGAPLTSWVDLTQVDVASRAEVTVGIGYETSEDASGLFTMRTLDGAAVNVGGLQFDVAMTTTYGAGVASTGTLRITGSDELVVDLSAIDEAGCAPAAIDGRAIDAVCAFAPNPGATEEPTPDPEVLPEINGTGFGFTEDEVWLSLETATTVELATVILFEASGREEWHPLSSTDAMAWEVTLAHGSYASGVSSEFSAVTALPAIAWTVYSEGKTVCVVTPDVSTAWSSVACDRVKILE